jgi:hypothetical protein
MLRECDDRMIACCGLGAAIGIRLRHRLIQRPFFLQIGMYEREANSSTFDDSSKSHEANRSRDSVAGWTGSPGCA